MHAGREEAKLARKESAIQTAAKAVLRTTEERANATTVLDLARAGQKWDSGTLESLKSAFRGMGGDKDKMKLKKAEFMPCIASLIAVRIAVPSSGQMPAEGEETVASPAPSPVNSDTEDD